jgi:hypothetical protein
MTADRGPTEAYDGRITVRLLDDESGVEDVACASYADAIDVVSARQHDVTTAKIVGRDDDVVFTSAEMEIDDWQAAWERERRRLNVDVEEHDCPHDHVACVADDLCLRCTMDAVGDKR